MDRRWIAVVLTSGLVLAACGSSSGDTTTPETGGDVATTVETDAIDVESDGVEAASATSMASLLDRIPLAVYDRAIEGSSVQIELVDYAAVAEATGAPRPRAADTDAALDWLLAVSTDGVEPPGFAILPTSFPDPGAVARSDEMAGELGFSVLDVDQASVVSAPPLSFAALSGDGVELASTLVDVGNGILTAGEGDDFAPDFDSVTAARPLGRPLRLAERGGVIAASTSTPAIESFVAGAPSALEVPDLAVAAEALDAAESVSALLLQSDFRRVGPEYDALEAGAFERVSVEFNTVGIGMAVIDGRAVVAAVYVFADETGAAVAGPELEELWRSSPLLAQQGTLVSDWFDLDAVEVRGSAVLVTASVVDGSSARRAPNMIFQSELLFTSP